MPCTYHPEVESTAFCTQCGHALCAGCVRMVRNSVYCEDCLAASVKKPNTTAQAVTGNDPETAFLLGLIPGVGAIYNGEYFKAAIHVSFRAGRRFAATPQWFRGPAPIPG